MESTDKLHPSGTPVVDEKLCDNEDLWYKKRRILDRHKTQKSVKKLGIPSRCIAFAKGYLPNVLNAFIKSREKPPSC